MFASLIPTQRTKVANNNVIGELVIRMPMLDEFGEEVIDGEYKNVVFLVPVVMTVHELRRRIAGEVNLPLKTLHLYLKGSLLDSDEMVPTEAFENLDALEYDSDEEFFRARICLQIYTYETTLYDTDGNEIAAYNESTQLQADIGIDIEPEPNGSESDDDQVAHLLAGSSKEMLELEARQEEAYNLQMKSFNLKEELSKIKCNKYYESLLSLGYGDLGAFCHLTDGTLSGKGLWVARIARTRILGLAEMLKRKHKLMMGDVRPKNSDGETQQAKAGFAVDGLDEIFTTKAAMKRAWAQTQSRTGTPALTNISTADSRKLPAAADEYHGLAPSLDLTADELSSVGASLVAFADGSYISRPPSPRPLISRTPKTISKQAMDLIAEIERIGKRDSFDCLVNAELLSDYPIVNKNPLHWCCDAHRLEFEFTYQIIEETKLDRTASEIKVAVQNADARGSRLLPRASLRSIINSQMKKHDMKYPADLVEKLLDASICNWNEVVVMKEWGRVGDNSAHYDGLPQIAYSVNTFARLLAEKLCDEETMRKYLLRDKTYKIQLKES